jgi:DNA polymerase-3 subunit psi
MKHQHAVFLQEMGIQHWQVRKPALFRGEKALKQLNLTACKLLVVCTQQDKQHPLMSSIINAFDIDADSVFYCTLAEFEHQQGNLPELIWSTLGEIDVSPNRHLLHSPSLALLNKQSAAKKSLWKQFCAYRQ